MKTKKSFKADLENKRALFALVGLVLALGFTYISFEWGKSDVQKNTDLVDFTKDDTDIENIEIPKTWQQPQREAAPVAKKVVTPKIVVVDKPETQDPKIEDLFVCNLPETPWITDSIDDGDDDPELIIDFVQKQASFPGGNKKLFDFLHDNLQYPQIARENNVQGRVYVQFVVNRDGSIQDIVLAKSADDNSLDQEALRVVKKMPKWIPAEQNDKPCRSRFILPILFKLK